MTNSLKAPVTKFRKAAEERARIDEVDTLNTLTLDDARQLFHELRVYQIEIEMHNEELRRTQHELEVSRTRYFDLYDLAPVGYLTLNGQGLILEANLAAATMFGLDRNSMLRMSITKLIFREDQDTYYLQRKKASESGDVQAWEMRLLHSDGSMFWARLQTTPGHGGEYWITIVDISKRKWAEDELHKSNELLHLFLKNSPIYTYINEVSASASRLIQASDNFEQLIGISSSKLVGKTMPKLFTKELARKMTKDDMNVVKSGKVIETEEVINGRIYSSIKFPIHQGDKTLLAGYAIDITERKKTEELLQESENRFRLLFDTAPIGICMTDQSGNILKFNNAMQLLTGYGPEELEDINIDDLYVNPSDRATLLDAVKDLGKIHGVEIAMKSKDGVFFHTLFNITLAEISGQQVLLACIQDITERKQEEMVLKARLTLSDYAIDCTLDELLKKIIDECEALTESSIGFFRFVDSDQINLSLLTWSSNTTCNDMLFTDGKRQHYPLEKAGLWADCIREKKALIHNDYESHPNRKGLPPGHPPLVRELVVPIFRNNLIVGVLGVGNKKTDYSDLDRSLIHNLADLAWDIVVRKQVEDSLKASEIKYSRLFESMTDAYCAVDMDGRFVQSNDAFQKMIGYSDEELKKLTYIQLTPNKWQAYEKEIIEPQIISNGCSELYQKELQRKDGSLIDVELKMYLIKADNSTATGMWAIVRDITVRKKMEQELMKAKEAADAANQAKSDFLATMSHEIRTPLGAMLGNVELLEGTPLTPQQQEYLYDCKTASRILLQVINDVLDFSKIEAGKLELVNETFSISSMGGQLVRMFSASAKQKGLELNFFFADDLPQYISCDQQRLRQIISNLLSNAIKFTKHGAVSLEITCDQAPCDSGRNEAALRVVVRDTGIGIPDNKLGLIFESFTQVENFSTRSASGTGLGLTISRRLLALMGGTVSVATVPGAGSTFTVIIPVVEVKVKVQAQTRKPGHAQASQRKILFADDDERGRSVALKLLQRRGYNVTAVENGTSLLETLQKEEFEIVLTDISMPDMDGTQVARIIRSGELPGVNPEIPIIAMTAHAFSDDRERFKAAGINGYVSKPVNLEDLFRQIEELCSK